MDGDQTAGIWIPHVADGDDVSEFESESEEDEESVHSENTSESEKLASGDESEHEVAVQVAGIGRFGALILDDEEDLEDGSEDDEK